MRIKTVMAAVMLLMSGSFSYAQQNVVGYNKFIIPANSDVKLTVPFTTTPYNGSGVQDSAAVFAASGASAGYISVSGLTAGVFTVSDVTKSSYYVRFLTGNAAGLWMTIKSNTANSILLDDTANLATLRDKLLLRVANNDTFRIYKHQTVGSVFPPGQVNVSYMIGTGLILFQNNVGYQFGQNPSSWKSLSYATSGGGRWVGGGDGNTIIQPETQFILRNNNLTQTLTFVTNGNAPDYPVSMLLGSNGDLVTGTGYPVPVVLKNSGLGGVSQRAVIFFSPTATGQNKSALKTVSYSTTQGGRWLGGLLGEDLINPSEAITYRLPAADVLGAMVTIKKPY